MAIEEWKTPATVMDDKYKINVTTVAAMIEMNKITELKETGEETKGSEYKGTISSTDLEEGVSITAENTIQDKEENKINYI